MLRNELVTRLSKAAQGATTLSEYKERMHAALPVVASGHLTEALSAAFGFKTNAALRAALREERSLLDSARFDAVRLLGRLTSLGYRIEDMHAGDAQADGGSGGRMPEAGIEPMLLRQDFHHWCSSYGVKLSEKRPGAWFASHVVGGVVGPFSSEELAAEGAFSAWN